MWPCDVRKMLITVFLRKNNATREYFRPVVQKLCSKYLSGQVHMYENLPDWVTCDEEESIGALGETVEL